MSEGPIVSIRGLEVAAPSRHGMLRPLRGIALLVHAQPGLCRKTRKAIPEAIRKSMERRPEIAYGLLDEGGLFEGM